MTLRDDLLRRAATAEAMSCVGCDTERRHAHAHEARVARMAAEKLPAEPDATAEAKLRAELAKITDERNAYQALTERMKLALRMPGTGSYVEWAEEVRARYDAYDAQSERLAKLAALPTFTSRDIEDLREAAAAVMSIGCGERLRNIAWRITRHVEARR